VNIDDMSPVPWQRHDWYGALISVDGTDAADFVRDDVAEVLAYATTAPSDWDGDAVAIVKLCDGRIVAWETDWGPTGNGFCLDAYGGGTDLLFCASVESACAALSIRAREMLDGAQ
jgi:hypothetical protein